jgi:hypothetical protein
VGTTLIAQWALPSTPPLPHCDVGILFNPVILSGTLSLAEPMTKWSRRTPTSINTARSNAGGRPILARPLRKSRVRHFSRFLRTGSPPRLPDRVFRESLPRAIDEGPSDHSRRHDWLVIPIRNADD